MLNMLDFCRFTSPGAFVSHLTIWRDKASTNWTIVSTAIKYQRKTKSFFEMLM
jgi:hypothetical protein